MIYSVIVAVSENWAIGKHNQLLWHLADDLKWFKNHTTGKTIIMGRKTFESIGRALPNRRNVVISRQSNFNAQGCDVYESFEQALETCKNQEVFVIGGAELYKSTLPKASKLYLTKVHHSFDGHVFFPEINPHDWECVFEQDGVQNEKNEYSHSFYIFERNKT